MQAESQPTLKFIVVAEENQQRMAFRDTIASWGFELIDCIHAKQLIGKHFLAEADIWLVDSEQDYKIIQILEKRFKQKQNTLKPDSPMATQNLRPSIVLVGFVPAPYLNESQPYSKWQRQLKRKIALSLSKPELIEKFTHETTEYRPWKYVVFIGASMGGPLAVKEFLDALPADLPIAIILAQHFDNAMINSLPRILNRHNGWRCEVIKNSQGLIAGRCLIMPIEQSVVCDSNGRIIVQKQEWQGRYEPSISQIMLNCSEAFGNNVIHIILSGMGNDGSDVAEKVKKNGSMIWAQQPSTCTCPSQPQSIIDTGLTDYIGTPTELAQALITLCKTEQLPNVPDEKETISYELTNTTE